LRKKQPATATSSQPPAANNRQPTANTSTSTRRNFSPGTWGFVWRGEGGFVGDNSKPRLSLLFPFLQALSRVMRIVGGMVLTWLLSCVL